MTFIYFMNTYILQTVVNNKPSTTATCHTFENLQKIMRDYDNSMTNAGYRKVRYERHHIGKKGLTNVTLHYMKV